ncbi:MAG: hypothetical protein PHQ60_11105 [Sideroxydans sp.]|nr:hypothetical protein [Sideroxydans sp.]
MMNLIKSIFLFASVLAGTAQAAVCTTNPTGNWGTNSTWSCGHVPLSTDTVVISRDITLNANDTIAGLTVNPGVTFNDGNRTLTINGDLTNNGTITGGGDMNVTGATAIISGNGTYTNSRLYVSGATTTIASGAILNFSGSSRLYAGRTEAGATIATSVLTINGTINSTVATATTTFLRLYANSTVIGSTGVINAAVSAVSFNTNTATITNNGSVSVNKITQRATTNAWTQGANSSLTLTATSTVGVLYASATGNTVNYSGAAQTVITPNGGTYANLTLSGSGVKTVPTGLTVAENFTMSDTATVAAPLALAVGGDFTIGAGNTFTPGAGTVTLNGAAAQTISGTSPLNFNNLNVTNAANPNITLTTDVNVNGTLSGTVNLTPTCPTDFTLTYNGGATVIHGCSVPHVTSINTGSTNPTNPATSVTWTVTFDMSVTGVDSADFVLVAGGGVTGASITGVAGGGTTWTVTANTGSGTGTLGLNLVDNDSIVSGGRPLGGPGAGNGNFTGQVYTVEALMSCVTDNFSTGVLDSTLWSVRTIMGAFTPAVVNVGGGDNRLRLTDTGGNEATFAQLNRTFPGAGNKVVLEIDYFAYGGTGADGIAVTFSDSTVSSTTGGFGGSLGYAPNGANDGFGGGWLGIGLDEYGNFPNPTEGRAGYPVGWTPPVGANSAAGFYKTNIAVRGSGSAATGYSLLANTGVLAIPVAPASGAAGATPYRYRFTLDHSDNVHAYVTVERDTTGTGGSYTTLVPQFDVKGVNSGQAAVPANWLVSFTGSTGGSTNNHEFKRVSICANTIAASVPHHLEIQHSSGTGLTCASNTLTIKACADAACTTVFTGGISGTLNAAGTPTVNWDGATGGATGAGFVIPSGSSSVTKDVQVATAGSVVFGIDTATATPVPTNATTCNFGSPACTFTANTAGFIFSDSATGSAVYTIPTLVSGVAHNSDNLLWLRAVQASTANAAVCTPAIINQTVAVDMGYSCNDPTSCQSGSLGNINGTPIAAGGSAVSLAFDANGSAKITSVRYDDVGQITLNANKTAIPFISGTAVTLNGSSNTFVVKPDHFELSGIQQTALPNLVNPAAANAAGAKFVKAGEDFTITVRAMNALGAVTMNYGQEISPESVRLTPTNVVAGMVAAPPITGSFGTFASGAATGTTFSWPEVGIITLTPGVGDASYLGTTDVPGTTSVNVGRFYPDHFDTVVSQVAGVPMNCPNLTCPANFNGMVYAGQPFNLTVTAKNLSGLTTANYNTTTGFAKSTALSAWGALGTTTPPAGAGALGVTNVTAFAAGSLTDAGENYTFTVSPTAPTNIFIRANDGEASSLRAIPANSVEGGVQVTSGRVKVSNAHGSELLALPISAKVQYYDGLGWATSTTDNLTSFDTTAALASVIIRKGPLAVGNVNVVNNGVAAATAGIIPFRLAVPGVSGSADISIPVPAYLTSELGRITFGVYKGANQFIYMREAY